MASSLAASKHLGGFLGDLAADGIDAALEQRSSCTNRRVASAARSAMVAHSVSSQAKPCVDRSAGAPSASKQLRVSRWQVGPTGSTVTSRASAIAVGGDVDEPEDVPAGLALAPQPVARAGVEVDLAGLDRGGQGLGVHVADHQDPPVVHVLDDCRDEPVGRERPRSASTGHATAWGRAGRTAGRRHGGLDVGDGVDPAVEDRRRQDRIGVAVPNRRDEVVGTGGATGRDDRDPDHRGDRAQQGGVEPGAGPVAVDRRHEELTGTELDRATGPRDSIEPGRVAPAADEDLPAGGTATSSASIATTTA